MMNPKAWGRCGLMAWLTVLTGCAALPTQDGRPTSLTVQVDNTARTWLGTTISARRAAHPTRTRVCPLGEGTDAFAARGVLAAAAECQLRVRRLLDKHNTADLDVLAAGSFNVDPRWALRITELHLAPDGRTLERTVRTPQGGWRHRTEPGTSTMRRLGVDQRSLLPIEWLL